MTPLRAILSTLAVYRLTKLIVSDEITADLREKITAHFGDPDENKVSYLVTCPHCSSIYAAALVAGANTLFPRSRVIQAATAALAYSAITGIMAEREDSF